MSLQDVDDLHGSLREAARVLRPQGRLCAAVVHPLTSAGRFVGRDPDSPFVVAGSYPDPRRHVDVALAQRDEPVGERHSQLRRVEQLAHLIAAQ
jgi:SAM-dependent methyltransferase